MEDSRTKAIVIYEHNRSINQSQNIADIHDCNGEKTMTRFEYGNPKSSNVLIQMVGDHDLAIIENEVRTIAEKSVEDFCLVALKVDNWNHDLSPWNAPAVFGNEAFGNGAGETLARVLDEISDPGKKYYIGGYSLAGLFALWTVYQTDKFEGVAAVSPSIWFPGFLDYMRENRNHTNSVYLSLGDKEEKTKNPVMATVGNQIRNAYDLLKDQGKNTILEWNSGNHFKDADIRTACGFAWLLNKL